VRDFSSTTKAQLRGARGPAGEVRAYGQVSSVGVLSHNAAGVTVTNPSAGLFCIAVAGVSSADTVAVVTPNFSADSTFTGANNTEAFVEYGSFGSSCPTSTDVAVTTFRRTFDATTHDTTLTQVNQAFSFLVP
jgi:hypothetical protein